MKTKPFVFVTVCSAQLVLLLSSCQPQVVTVEITRLVAASNAPEATPRPTFPATTETPLSARLAPEPSPVVVTVEVTRPALGSDERPVQLLFPPVADAAVIIARGEALAQALERATGRAFAVGIADNEQALVELLCGAPADTIGVLSAAAYTIAHDQCDAQATLVARHDDGLTWQAGMIVTGRGGATDLADLDGGRWAVADTTSLPTYLYFRAAMAEAGIEPAEVVTTPEDTTALLALRDGTVDFTSAAFVPPILPYDREWVYGESDPEEWRLLGIAPSRSPIGYVVVAGDPENGGYRLRDARARLLDTTPDIFDVTRILALSEPIPNETVVFGADLPYSLAQQALATLVEFAASEACRTSLCSTDFYGWTGLEPVDDAAYDPIRHITDTLGLEAADLWSELD